MPAAVSNSGSRDAQRETLTWNDKRWGIIRNVGPASDLIQETHASYSSPNSGLSTRPCW